MLFGWRAATTRRAGVLTAAAAVALLLALAAGAVATAAPRTGGYLRVEGTTEHANLPEYGAEGSEVVRYLHGREITVRFPLRNPGLLPLTVEAIDPFPTVLGLLTPGRITVDGRALPATIAPRSTATVTVRARFENCPYFTERAIDTSEAARVTWSTLGIARTAQVAYADALLVRSPTIIDCPGRVLDRSAKQRMRDATITGRG